MNAIKYTLLLFLVATSMRAQNISDALRFSQVAPLGTARTVGVGNAFGAMGGDFSIVGINPAGLAEFKKSEFSISPLIQNSEVGAYFVDDPGNKLTRTDNHFGLSNIGMVAVKNNRKKIIVSGKDTLYRNDKRPSWKTRNFAIGLMRISSMGATMTLTGDTKGSIANRFLQISDGVALDDLDAFEAGPAYDAGVIYLDEAGNYTSDYRSDDVVTKKQSIEQSGSIDELSFTWAGNYDDKFNFGLGLGVPFVTYNETKQYNEKLVDGSFSNGLVFREVLSTSGVGVNMKLGLQYHPSKMVRVGLALHSPTYYAITDDFNTIMSYKYISLEDSYSGHAQSPDGSFKYKFSTPWKAIGSVGSIFILGDLKGFVNADIEYLDYANNKFNFKAFSNDPLESIYAQEINEQIDSELGAATTIRIGGEIAYKVLRFRAGYEFGQSPFRQEKINPKMWSVGLGLRQDRFFIDVAYRQIKTAEGYTPYTVTPAQLEPFAKVNRNTGNVVVTAGFKF